MSRLRLHPETHLVDRIGWLRAAVLGANDGIISTASLIVGVAAAAAAQSDVLIAGIAGLVAGAMSMAAGEYVSVSSQSDTEQADLARERKELTDNPEFELAELAEIYVKRGVDQPLARPQQLMAKDDLTAHARDELARMKNRRDLRRGRQVVRVDCSRRAPHVRAVRRRYCRRSRACFRPQPVGRAGWTAAAPRGVRRCRRRRRGEMPRRTGSAAWDSSQQLPAAPRARLRQRRITA